MTEAVLGVVIVLMTIALYATLQGIAHQLYRSASALEQRR